jgi:hypothetical protein
MTEIRIRHELDETGQKVGEVAFDETALDQVIPLLSRWGVADRDGEMYGVSEMVAQFKISDSAAYFEVILVGSDE